MSEVATDKPVDRRATARDEPTHLQAAIAQALAEAPNSREHYDRMIQRATGTSGKPIYDIVRGKVRDPRISTLRQIAAALDRPLSFFLPAEGEFGSLRIVDKKPIRIVANLISFAARDGVGDCELWLEIENWNRVQEEAPASDDPKTRHDHALSTLERRAAGHSPTITPSGLRLLLL